MSDILPSNAETPGRTAEVALPTTDLQPPINVPNRRQTGRFGWFGALLGLIGSIVFYLGLLWAAWACLTLPFSPMVCSGNGPAAAPSCQSLHELWSPLVFWLAFMFVWLPLMPIVTGLYSIPTSLLGMLMCWVGGRRVFGTGN